MPDRKKILVSLHDIAPFHLDRLKEAAALLRDLAVARAGFLFVPEFHGDVSSGRSAEFAHWCRDISERMDVEWFLHGYRHQEDRSARREFPVSPLQRLKSRLLTGSEGEFLGLGPSGIRERLQKGKEIFSGSVAGASLAGFIAPGWLFNRHLVPILKEEGLVFTEDYRRIHDVRTGDFWKCPVITWATRTRLRKHGSLIAGRLCLRLWRDQPLLRVAMHPYDFDHPETVTEIRRLLETALQDREVSRYRDLSPGRRC
jgi:predicted deacetylase